MTTDMEFSRLLRKVAMAYYDDGLTQQQIGERFGLSRVKVSRLLRSAREEKVVQITITPPQSPNAQIEQQLERKYGLKEALVVTPSSYAPATLVGELGPGDGRSNRVSVARPRRHEYQLKGWSA